MKNQFEKLPAFYNLRIQEIVCREMNIPISDLLKKRRNAEFVKARQMYFALLRNVFMISSKSIQRNTGFNHATILHAVKEAETQVEVDRFYREQYTRIEAIAMNFKNMIPLFSKITTQRYFLPRTSIRMSLKHNPRVGNRMISSNIRF